MSFDEKVWKLLKKIPKGKVTTYKELAMALGKPMAARVVGNACNRNPFAPKVPCHRVVKSSGFVGEYTKGWKRKEALLRREGIKIKNHKILSFKWILFRASDFE